MQTFFYKVSIGLAGCDSTGLIQGESEDKLTDTMHGVAIENAESYGYHQDEERLESLDSVGGDACCECSGEGCDDCGDTGYSEVTEVDWVLKLYCPETHNCELLGTAHPGYIEVD